MTKVFDFIDEAREKLWKDKHQEIMSLVDPETQKVYQQMVQIQNRTGQSGPGTVAQRLFKAVPYTPSLTNGAYQGSTNLTSAFPSKKGADG